MYIYIYIHMYVQRDLFTCVCKVPHKMPHAVRVLQLYILYMYVCIHMIYDFNYICASTIYTYIYSYVCIHMIYDMTLSRVCVCPGMRLCPTYIYAYIYTCIEMYTCIYLCTYIYIYVYMCMWRASFPCVCAMSQTCCYLTWRQMCLCAPPISARPNQWFIFTAWLPDLRNSCYLSSSTNIISLVWRIKRSRIWSSAQN